MNLSSRELLAMFANAPKEAQDDVRRQLGAADAAPAKRRNKYGNVRTFALGQTWDSIKEAKHAEALDMASRGGPVQWWAFKPRFILESGIYIPDFVECWANVVHIVDVKGGDATKTKAYRMNKRAMLRRYNVEIMEV